MFSSTQVARPGWCSQNGGSDVVGSPEKKGKTTQKDDPKGKVKANQGPDPDGKQKVMQEGVSKVVN